MVHLMHQSMPGFDYGSFNAPRSFLSNVKKGSGRLKSLRQSLTSGAPKTAFAEDLKSFKKSIFDPQDKLLFRMNWVFSRHVLLLLQWIHCSSSYPLSTSIKMAIQPSLI